MTSNTKVAHSFRRALQSYDLHAVVQRDIAEQLLREFLTVLQSSPNQKTRYARVFEIGCGTGFFTKKMLENLEVQDLVLNDLVVDCQQLLMPQLAIKNNQFVAGDIESIPFPAEIDIVCAASVLQWIKNTPELLTKIADCLRPDGWLVCSSFQPGHFYQLAEVQRSLGVEMPDMSYFDSSQWQMMLGELFNVVSIQQQEVTIWFNSVDEVLQHLRKTGVNGRSRQQWSAGAKQQFSQCYQQMFEQDGRLPLSYQPIYVVARKG